MLKQLNKIVQQKLFANYNKIKNKAGETSYEDAAFITFLDLLYNILMGLFIIFGIISLSLFFTYEILPLLN